MANENNEKIYTKYGREVKLRFQISNKDKSNKSNINNKMLGRDDPRNEENNRERANQQEVIDRLQAELTTLRETLEKQRVDFEAKVEEEIKARNVQREAEPEPRNPPAQGPVEDIAREFAAVMSHMRPSQHVDIKQPKFEGQGKHNPVEYINQLEKFFKIKKIIIESDKLIIAENGLEGMASQWFDTQKEFETYAQFKK